MRLADQISLQKQAEFANKQFTATESRLSKIEGSFVTRTKGKTRGKMVGAVFATILWFAAVCIAFCLTAGVNVVLRGVSFAVVLALLVFLFLDECIGFSYYGKILTYRDRILQLINRINIGKSSIKSNQDVFMGSFTKGWDYPLTAGKSIPEEAASVESTINGMESLKGGFINGMKNFLFYTAVVAITVTGSMALFGTAYGIMDGIGGAVVDSDVGEGTAYVLSIVGMVIALVIEIILAKMAWSATDCSVTNKTLFVLLAAPLVFLAVVLVGTLIVVLVMWAIAIILALVGLAIGGATLCAISNGG